MAASHTQTVMNSLVLPTACVSEPFPCSLMRSLAAGLSALQIDGHQVDHRKHEHPDQVHKVPVQPADLDVIGIELASTIADGHDNQINHSDGYVSHMHAGDTEERGAKQRYATSRSGR